MRLRFSTSFWLHRLHWLLAVMLLSGSPLLRAAVDFLDPEAAFKMTVQVADARSVEVTFAIAPGYYLYRDQFKFNAVGATLAAAVAPAGKVKFDETFQKNVETYRDSVRIVVPVQQAASNFRLLVTSQGCAEKGLCYPPAQHGVEVRLAAFGGDASAGAVALVDPPISSDAELAGVTSPAEPSPTSVSTTLRPGAGDGLDGALRRGHFWPVVGVFFVAGLLLSLTPCVLPMLPILSSIIVGHGEKASRGRGLGLAASYSLGMALIYTALGVAAGLAGEGLAAALQNSWVVSAFAAALVVLALSMFGVYELQLPSAVTGRLTKTSQGLPAGKVVSVFAMGGMSALIVSPCVAAPLAGALVYLSQTRNVWLGGSALFSLAAGMSVPLLLVGASAGALLPRAGPWMNEVKHFFGLMLLGVALWTVQVLLPPTLVLAVWGALLVATAVLLVSSTTRAHRGVGGGLGLLRRSMAAVVGICGLMQLVGAASGGSDPLQPLAHFKTARSHGDATARPMFARVRDVVELDAALRDAGRPVMLDFYADWCVSCKEMERYTFADPAVKLKLAGALLLKADVTANSADDRALLRRFQLFGPPGTIFFDAQGREIAEARLIGYQDSVQFQRTLQKAGL